MFSPKLCIAVPCCTYFKFDVFQSFLIPTLWFLICQKHVWTFKVPNIRYKLQEPMYTRVTSDCAKFYLKDIISGWWNRCGVHWNFWGFGATEYFWRSNRHQIITICSSLARFVGTLFLQIWNHEKKNEILIIKFKYQIYPWLTWKWTEQWKLSNIEQ